MIEYNLKFHGSIEYALEMQKEYESTLNDITTYLRHISPQDYNYYMHGKGFVEVNVESKYVDDYLMFFDDLVGCKYTCMDNLNGVTFLLSISTLNDCLDELCSGK